MERIRQLLRLEIQGNVLSQRILFLGVMLVAFAVGAGMEVVFVLTGISEGVVVGVGQMMAGGMLGIMLFFNQSIGMTLEFNSALRFQRTRKQFFLRYLVEKICDLTVGLLIFFILGWAEKALMGVLFPGTPVMEDLDLAARIPVWCYPFGILFFLGTAALLGGAALKLESKGPYLWCAVWVLLCLGPVNLARNKELFARGTALGGLLSFWMGLGLFVQMLLLGGVGVLFLWGTWGLLRRQRVTE